MVIGNAECTTCQKALQYLRYKAVTVRACDLKTQPLEAAEVEDLARKVGRSS